MALRRRDLIRWSGAAAVAGIACSPAGAAELTVKDVSELLARSAAGAPADLSSRDLSRLDLSELDFRRADLTGADLFGADLTDADFSGANLAGARLDRTVIIRANFAGANLAGATLVLPQASPGLDPSTPDAPSFKEANLSQATILARLARADFRGADASGLRSAVRGGEHVVRMRNDLSGARFGGARLIGADLREVNLAFADLSQADLSDANLRRADLTGANLDGARFRGADLDGAILRDVRGIERARDLDRARNLAAAVR
jgi:uncharacterized protein YjbI with pentapeptide repeats